MMPLYQLQGNLIALRLQQGIFGLARGLIGCTMSTLCNASIVRIPFMYPQDQVAVDSPRMGQQADQIAIYEPDVEEVLN